MRIVAETPPRTEAAKPQAENRDLSNGVHKFLVPRIVNVAADFVVVAERPAFAVSALAAFVVVAAAFAVVASATAESQKLVLDTLARVQQALLFQTMNCCLS